MSLQNYQQPNPTVLQQKRTQKVFEDIQRRFQTQELLTHDDIRGAVYEAISQAYLHAGEPTFDGGTLPSTQPRLRRHYSEPILKLLNDLYALYKELQSVNQAATASFNFQQTLLRMLDGRVKRVGGTLTDLEISSGRFNEAVIVAGDDFTDTSRIDKEAALTLPRADVQPLGNILTLRREGNQSAVQGSKINVTVQPLQDYRFRPYEGQFFGLLGQAVPEGGVFHLARKSKGASRSNLLGGDLLSRFQSFFSGDDSAPNAASQGIQTARQRAKLDAIVGAANAAQNGGEFGGFTTAEWEILGANGHQLSELSLLLPGEVPEFPLSRDANTVHVDEGASAEVRLEGRRAMFDGSADTFWQIEYVTDVGTQASKLVELGEDSELYPERVGAFSQFLQQSGRGFDTLDFDIRIQADLGTSQAVNWIDLEPVFLDGIEGLEIIKAETSLDGTEWSEIASLQSSTGDSFISENSSRENIPGVAEATLTPGAGAFTGKGLWIFAPRTIRYVRFDLRQTVPVLVPYQIKAFQTTRQVHRRHSRSSTGRRRSSTTSTETTTIKLSYPETLLATAGDQDPGVTTPAFQVESDGSTSAQRVARRAQIFPIGSHAIISSLFGPGGAGGKTSYGEGQITKEWLETKWDKARYAIAIRDIGIWRYRFAEQSEIVSVPFRSPQAIRDISLEVDENIPAQFNEAQNVESWIDYYVGIGEGQDWIPIAPTTSRVVRSLEGNRLSSVIHLNSGIPVSERRAGDAYVDLDGEVYEVRFRAVLRRPTGGANPEAFTPTLKAYRLIMTMRENTR